MSKLGNLFGGGGDADSNDALKYSAPKEPKKAMPVAASPVSATPAASSAPAAKMMASATVRLYKVNPTTGAFEVQAGGGPLGCVIFGTGLQNQILVYNAQRAPQATVSINAEFAYNIRDTYVSFADSLRNNWSLLFDNEDVMQKFLRALVATIAHVACFSEPTGSRTITGALPGATTTSTDDGDSATILSAGFLAGIQYKAWELCADASESPADAIASTPFKTVSLPDLAKVKVTTDGSSVDEPLGGISMSLLNRKKGDRFMLAIPPVIAQRGTLDMRSRSKPTAWVLVEVEIVKVKDGAKEKKEKKDKSSAAEQNVPFNNAPAGTESNERSNSIKDRMAHLASAGGGAVPMLIPVNSNVGSGREEQPQANYVNSQPGNAYASTPQGQNMSIPQQSAPQQMAPPAQYVPQHQLQQQQQPYVNHGQPPQQQQFSNYQQQQPNSYNTTQLQQQNYMNAIALVPGQDARSHFVGDMSQQNGMQGRYPVERHMMSNPGQDGGNPYILQQSVSNIQASLMQLHGKMDTLLGMSGGMSMGGMNPMMMYGMQQPGYRNEPSMKGRGQEVIAMVTSMVEEFDKKTSSSSVDGDATKAQIAKLEEKIEALQTRNEKLMQEKSDLLDRQSNMLQTSAQSSSQNYELQRQVETLRRDKEQSDFQLADMMKNMSMLQQQAQYGGQDRARLSAVESDLSRVQNEKRTLEQTVLELKEKASYDDSKWSERLSEERNIRELSTNQLMEANKRIDSLNNELNELRRRCDDVERTASQGALLAPEDDPKVKELLAIRISQALQNARNDHDNQLKSQNETFFREKEQLNKQLSDLNSTVANLSDELLKMSSEKSAPAHSGSITQDQVKDVVQAMYGKLHERFVPDGGSDEDKSYTPGEVMQQIRGVMKSAVSDYMNSK